MDQVAHSILFYGIKQNHCIILNQERKGWSAAWESCLGPTVGSPALCAAHSSRMSLLLLRTCTQTLHSAGGGWWQPRTSVSTFKTQSFKFSKCSEFASSFDLESSFSLSAGRSICRADNVCGSSLTQQRDFIPRSVVPKYMVISIS